MVDSLAVLHSLPRIGTKKGYVLVALLAFGFARLAHGAEPSPFSEGGPLAPFEGRHPNPPAAVPPSAVWGEVHVGLSTPVGIGGAVDFQPFPWLALNVGFGSRAYLAGTARVNLWTWNSGHCISIGGGYSTGPYRWSNQGFMDDSPDVHTKTWSNAQWRNVLVSFGSRTVPSRWRVYVGYATLLNPYDYRCSIDPSSELYEPLCTGPGADYAFMIGGAFGWGTALW